MPSKFEKTNKSAIYLRGRTYYASVTSGGVTCKIAAGPKIDAAVRLKRKLRPRATAARTCAPSASAKARRLRRRVAGDLQRP
jgi:hypothetical protein